MGVASSKTFETAEQAALIEALEEAVYDKRRAQHSLQEAFKKVDEQDTAEIAELEAELAELQE